MPQMKGHHHQDLVRKAQGLAPLRTAVVHPVDEVSLAGAIEAGKENLIVPVLVGPEAKIRAAAKAAQLDLTGNEIVNTEHSHAAAAKAVALARDRKVEALMKGSLHTDEFMGAIVREETASHGPAHQPCLHHGLSRPIRGRCSSPMPRLTSPQRSRTRSTSCRTPSSLPTRWASRRRKSHSFPLSKPLRRRSSRPRRGGALQDGRSRQITGGLLDGPLAFDNAVTFEAATTKNIVSPVAGQADILVVPDLEAGNMLAKQLEYLADADVAGIVLGARVPIILTSRADKTLARLGSCAVALLLARHKAEVEP